MKKKRTNIVFLVSILSLTAFVALFFLRKNFVREDKESTVSPADFIESKRHAFDLLGGLANRGFRVRDGVWEISLKPKKMELLQLTLFAGNQYWFAVAASTPAQRLKLALYNDAGDPIALDLWKDDHAISGARMAGGLVITRSGNYYIGVELLEEESEKAVPASLVYAYQ